MWTKCGSPYKESQSRSLPLDRTSTQECKLGVYAKAILQRCAAPTLPTPQLSELDDKQTDKFISKRPPNSKTKHKNNLTKGKENLQKQWEYNSNKMEPVSSTAGKSLTQDRLEPSGYRPEMPRTSTTPVSE